MMGFQRMRTGAGLALAAALFAAPLAAQAISFSGTDVQAQFTAYSATSGPDTPGVFTFWDSLQGTNPTPSAGTVTAQDGMTGLVNGQIDLELLLDLSGGFDPATGKTKDASFTGTGGGEIMIWDATRTTLLLVFDVSFIDVRNVNGLGTSNNIVMGDPEGSIDRVNSEITLVGGSLASAVGGIGHLATLDIQFDPQPELPGTFSQFQQGYPGFLNQSLSGGTNWSITMTPEPGTGLLLASALVALGIQRRRRRC